MSRNPAFGVTSVVCMMLLAMPCSAETPADPAGKDVSVLVLLGEWFGDAYFPLAERIEACGWRMSRVGVDSSYRGCYNKARDVLLHSDILIKDLTDFSDYDCLIIPSGPQFRKFITNEAVLQFVRDAYGAGLLLASFCTGNMVVTASGLYETPEGSWPSPETVTLVKERILLGPRGGGPPPGDGYRSAPIDALCGAIAKQLGVAYADSSSPPTSGAPEAAGTELPVGTSEPTKSGKDVP